MTSSLRSLLPIALSFALALGCGDKKGTQSTLPQGGKEVSLESVGLSSAAIDKSADACTDFFQYACGGWIKNTEIPADKARWGRGFSQIQKRNQTELKRMLEAAAQSSDPGMKKVGEYYASCMNEAAIEAKGVAPIKPLLDQLSAVKDTAQISAAVGTLHKHGIGAIFKIDVDADFKDPNLMIAHFYQGGLGLPDRDYYVKDDPASQRLRKLYVEHVGRTFQLAGRSKEEAEAAAKSVMALETEMARLHKTRVQMRDVKGMYNRVDRTGLEKASKSFDWKGYFGALGASFDAISVTTPKLMEGLDGLLSAHPASTWATYLSWKLLSDAADLLDKKMVDESFAMQSALSGQKTLEPRWKRCVKATDGALPDLVSQGFIKTMFPGTSKEAAVAMVRAISDAFGRNLDGYTWMDDKTRARAAKKRKMMEYLIGYPDTWKTYDFSTAPDSYAANAIAAAAHEQARELAKIGKPVNRKDWAMSASTVNAYYHPLRNHMVFPAGILQPPFYDVKASVAVNLGSMGMIVGHELTHGFDDMGSQFSAEGKLENWWEPGVAAKFNAKKQCLIDQYNQYEVLPGLHVNGELTLGENIADLGGVKLAYQAYKKMRAGQAPITAGGYTEDQQFFLAVGQAWCSKSREQIARMLVKVDPHSPPKFRVNGSVTSMPEFAKAFSCKPNTPMNPAKRCEVW